MNCPGQEDSMRTGMSQKFYKAVLIFYGYNFLLDSQTQNGAWDSEA